MNEEHESAGVGVDLQRTVDEYVQDVRPPPAEVLKLDFVYEALAHPRRRYLCYSLLSSSRWTLTGLATKVVAWERDVPERDVARLDRDEMYASLYHTHVPKLVELGIIEFADDDEEVITADGHAPQVLAALQGAGASLDAVQETHARNDCNRSDH